jgi:hypothetical protein
LSAACGCRGDDMIAQETVSNAVMFLRDNSPKAANARAERQYLEEFSKVVKSQQMKLFEGSIANREMEAYASGAYLTHLEAVKIAVEQDEYQRHIMKAAETVVEVWRSEQATERALGKV